MLDTEGRPKFGELVRRSRLCKSISITAASRSRPAVIFAFDLLELSGWDLRRQPLLERKALLNKTLKAANRIRYVEYVDDGLRLFAAAEEAGLEGIVAKKAEAPYGVARRATGSRSRRRPAKRWYKTGESGTSVRPESLPPLAVARQPNRLP